MLHRLNWCVATPWRRACLIAALAAALVTAVPSAAAASDPACRLPGPVGSVSHVVYIQFDNVHFRRDNPNVPSDLEQMPHLLNFIERGGALLNNEHTPLVSHTADDLLTSITGLYGDRHGMPIANEYNVYQSGGTAIPAGSFAYWTDPIVPYTDTAHTSDTLPTLVGPGGVNPPAPWVPYTRAGCNVGSVAMVNTELENTTPDIANVYGAGSPQAAEANANPSLAQTDFMGLSIHCVRGAALCSPANGGVTDALPSEPGGYSGFDALFGNKYIAPAITGAPTFSNLDGRPITDSAGNPGFPGYGGMQAVNALAYTLALQTHGVPITYTYIASAHETDGGTQWGPGQVAYVEHLRNYDRAFATFFSRLAAAGITPANSLFVFGSDENDQFVGSSASPAGCDGLTIPCSYSQIGEIDANVQGLLAQQGITTPFTLTQDSAPEFYLHDQPPATDPAVRAFERKTAGLTVTNPYTGATDMLSSYLADPTELGLLHMVTADPARTPTFAMFANPSYWVQASGPSCGASCTSFDPEAYNHGDVQPQITNTWMGMVGPGVARLGTSAVWSDHTDIRPTMLALLGLRDDYVAQGRVLDEILAADARPGAAAAPDYAALAEVYKQIEAPVGELATYTLRASTHALASTTPGDSTYQRIESQLADIADRRDALGAQMIELLDDAAFHGRPIDYAQAQSLEDAGHALIARALALAQ